MGIYNVCFYYVYKIKIKFFINVINEQ